MTRIFADQHAKASARFIVQMQFVSGEAEIGLAFHSAK